MFKKILCWMLIIQQINLQALQAGPGGTKVNIERADPERRGPAHSPSLSLQVQRDSSKKKPFKQSFEIDPLGEQRFKPVTSLNTSPEEIRIELKEKNKHLWVSSALKEEHFSLHVSPDGTLLVQGTRCQDPLSLHSFGDVFFGNSYSKGGIHVQDLVASGATINNTVPLYVSTLSLRAQNRIFNDVEGQFHLGPKTDFEGNVLNKGRFFLSGSSVGSHNYDYTNGDVGQAEKPLFKTYLTWAGKSDFRNVNIFTNNTFMFPKEGDIFAELFVGAQVFRNRRSILGISLEFPCRFFHNERGAILRTGTLILPADTVRNDGIVVVTKKADLNVGEYVNSLTGCWVLPEDVTVRSGSFTNHHSLVGSAFNLASDAFENLRYAATLGDFKAEVSDRFGNGEDALLASLKDLLLSGTSDVRIQGLMVGVGKVNVDARRVSNQSKVVSDTRVTIRTRPEGNLIVAKDDFDFWNEDLVYGPDIRIEAYRGMNRGQVNDVISPFLLPTLQGLIAPHTLEVKADKRFIHLGHSFGGDRVLLLGDGTQVVLKDLVTNGTLTSKARRLINRGNILANVGEVEGLRFTNERLFHVVESGHVAARHITNEDELSSEGTLDLEPRKTFKNKAGALVSAVGPLAIKGSGESHNLGNLESEDRIDKQVNRSLNHGQMIAENEITVDTTAYPLSPDLGPDFVNTNLMLSTNVTAKFERGVNEGAANGPLDVTNPNTLRGAIAERVLLFDIGNQLENRGPLVGKEEARFAGRGRLFNEARGSIKGDRISSLVSGFTNERGLVRANEHLEFDQLRETLNNSGLMLSDGSVRVNSTSKGVNSGVMEGRDGLFSLTFDETENNGLMSALGGDFLLKTRLGGNRGHMRGKHALGLTIGEQFSNGGAGSTDDTSIKSGEALTVEGTGVLTNERDVISGGALSVKNKKLENKAGSHVQAKGPITVAGGTTVSNDKDARLLSDAHIEGEEGSTVESDGFLSGDTVTLRQPLYKSGGDTEARGDIDLPNCTKFSIEKGGSITTTEGALLLPKAQTVVTEGPVYSEKSVSLTSLVSFKNSEKFETHGHLGLTATNTIENTDKLLGKAGIDLKALTITSSGPMISEGDIKLQAPSITLQGTTQGRNIEVHQPANEVTGAKASPLSFDPALVKPLERLTLNLPGGWDMQGQQKTLEHSVTFTGPILKPARLVIKGDFTWNCPGDLQNFFDIIVEGILTINFTTGGSWTSHAKVQGQKGMVANPSRFINRGAFYSGGTTTFTCPLGFDNYGAIELKGDVTVNAHQGEIRNRETAKLHQKNLARQTNSVTFIAARDIINDNGEILLQGNLTSQSARLINQTRVLPSQPTVKLYVDPRPNPQRTRGSERKMRSLKIDIPKGKKRTSNFRKGPTMSETDNARKDIPIDRDGSRVEENRGGKYGALFYAGGATISTGQFLNDGSTFTTDRHFIFNGSSLHNLTRNFHETGWWWVMRDVPSEKKVKKKKSKKFAGVKYGTKKKTETETTTTSQPVYESYNLPWLEFTSRLYCKGYMTVTLNGITQTFSGKVPFTQESKRNRKFVHKKRHARHKFDDFEGFLSSKRSRGIPTPVPDLNNTGHMQALWKQITGGTFQNGSDAIGPKQVNPTFVAAADYFSSRSLERPSFWKADPFRSTGALIVPDKPISSATEEEIAQLIYLQNLPPQGSPEYLKDLEAKLSAALKRNITLSGGTTVSKFWEVRRDDLATFKDSLTPKTLVQVPPRIAVIQDGRLTGDERMHHHPALLAEIVTRAFLDVIGYASISQSISSPELLTRVLEEVGYLNASRHRGHTTVPTPQNWADLSPQAQIAHQQRAFTTYQEAERFKDPSLVYRVWEDLGERVLSALVMLPQFIRDRFTALPGHLVAEYLSIQCRDVKNIKGTMKGEKAVYIETQGSILNREGTIESGGLLAIESGQALQNESGAIESGTNRSLPNRDMSLHAQDIFTSTLTTRQYFQGGYRDVLHARGRFRSGGDLIAHADRLFHGTASDISAVRNVSVYGGSHLYMGAQETETSLTVSQKKYTYQCQTNTNHKMNVYGHNVTIGSGGDIHTRGIDVTAVDKRDIVAEGGIREDAVFDSVSETATSTSTKRKFLKGKQKKTTTTTTHSSVPQSDMLRANVGSFLGNDNISLQAPQIHDRKTLIKSTRGKAFFRGASATYTKSTQKTKSNKFYASQKNTGKLRTSVVMPQFSGALEVDCAQGSVVDVPCPTDSKGNVTQSLTGILNQLQQNPVTAWIKTLRQDPKTKWKQVEEEHKTWSKKVSGLKPGATAMIGLAVCIATAGIGNAVSGSVLLTQALGQTGALMVGAGAQTAAASLCTQASVSFFNNQGDISKTFKDLSSSRNIQALLTSAGSAALTAGLLGNIGLPADDTGWQSRMLRSAVNNGVMTGERILSKDLKPGAAILQGFANVAANTFTALGAQAIGDRTQSGTGNLSVGDWLENKGLHALSAAAGAVISTFKNPSWENIAGAAMGAVTAETFAEMLPASLSPTMRSNIAISAAATLAFLTNQDVNAAIQAGTTAVEFNYEAHKSGPLAQKLTEDEFVQVHLEDWERKKGPLSDQDRERMTYEFKRGYYAFRMMDFSRSFGNPGQQRFEEQSALSFDEFRAQYLSQMDPQKRATVQGRQDAERIIINHWNHLQGLPFTMVAGAVLGALGGGTASLKPMFGGRRVASLSEPPMSANRNIQALDLAEVAQRASEKLRPAESSYYSNVFQVRLKRGTDFPGKPDRAHFQEANKQLYSAMLKDPQLKQMLEREFPGIQDSVKPSVNGHFPSRPPVDRGLTWHHNAYEPGLMELMLRRDHRAPGSVQSNLHPNQKGGMELWGGGRQANKSVERK